MPVSRVDRPRSNYAQVPAGRGDRDPGGTAAWHTGIPDRSAVIPAHGAPADAGPGPLPGDSRPRASAAPAAEPAHAASGGPSGPAERWPARAPGPDDARPPPRGAGRG